MTIKRRDFLNGVALGAAGLLASPERLAAIDQAHRAVQEVLSA